MPGRLVHVDVDREHEVEPLDRALEPAAVRRRDERVAGDGDRARAPGPRRACRSPRRARTTGSSPKYSGSPRTRLVPAPEAHAASRRRPAPRSSSGPPPRAVNMRAALAVEVAREHVQHVHQPARVRAELLRAGADPPVDRARARPPPARAPSAGSRRPRSRTRPPPPPAGTRARARAPRRARSGARRARPTSSRPSSTIVHAIAASSSASVPGRMKWCSDASSAVRVRRGSTTTTLPPRSRIARSRPRMFGAVRRLPFETSGLAPSSSRWSQRSTSGIGTDSIVPNM